MLEQKLNELEQSDIYPFHMPGHKRAFLPFANPYAIDITEIEGSAAFCCASCRIPVAW